MKLKVHALGLCSSMYIYRTPEPPDIYKTGYQHPAPLSPHMLVPLRTKPRSPHRLIHKRLHRIRQKIMQLIHKHRLPRNRLRQRKLVEHRPPARLRQRRNELRPVRVPHVRVLLPQTRAREVLARRGGGGREEDAGAGAGVLGIGALVNGVKELLDALKEDMRGLVDGEMEGLVEVMSDG